MQEESRCASLACIHSSSLAKASPEQDPEKEKEEKFILYCIRRDVLRHMPGLKKLSKRLWKDERFSTIGTSIDYTTLPPRFEVFLLKSLLDQVTGFDTALEKRLTRLLQPHEQGTKREMFVRAILPERDNDDENVYSKTIYVELPYGAERKDPFALPDDENPSIEHKWRRHNTLEVAAFDKVDQYLINEHSRLTPPPKDEKSIENKLKEAVKGKTHYRIVTPLPKM